jgi:hypothetical protein
MSKKMDRCQGNLALVFYLYKWKRRREMDIPDELKTIEGFENEWKPIEGYPGYEISIYGEVYSKKLGDTLVPQKNMWGYYFVQLYNEHGEKMFTVHRLVAEAFIPNPYGKPQVNHIDGHKRNNRVNNLEWCTNSENEKHAFKLGLKQPSRRKKIRIIETGNVYLSMHDCAREINGNFKAISNCIRGKSKTHKGYHYEVIADGI